MPPQEILLIVFCMVDDRIQALGLPPLRARGPRPAPADSEVLTLELVAALWGMADDRAISSHFRRHHAAESPALARLHRTTFARQSANLCWLKQGLLRRLAEHFDP